MKTTTNRKQSTDALRKQVRRDLPAAQLPTVLQSMIHMAYIQVSPKGNEVNAAAYGRPTARASNDDDGKRERTEDD